MRSRLSLATTCFFLTVSFLSTTDVSAKQCVFNKGGYVLKVEWVRPNSVAFDPHLETIDWPGEPVKSDTLTAGFGSCTPTDELLVAYIFVPGCVRVVFPNGIAGSCIGDTTLPRTHMTNRATLRTRVDGIMSPFPAPIKCRFPDATGLCGASTAFVPAWGAMVLVDQPSVTRYLDFWGGVGDVRWGEGGPIPTCATWVDGVDSSLTSDPGRGITNPQPHYQYIAGGGSGATVAGFVGNRMSNRSACTSRESFAKLYAAVSVAIAAVGRTHAGWIDGADSRAGKDPGRGVSDSNAHYGWVATGPGIYAAPEFITERMGVLSSRVPRDVFAKLYSDVSVLIARCGVSGICG